MHVVIPPLAVDGPSLSIRRFSIGRSRSSWGTLAASTTKSPPRWGRAAASWSVAGPARARRRRSTRCPSFIDETDRVASRRSRAAPAPAARRAPREPPRKSVQGRGLAETSAICCGAPCAWRPDRIVIGAGARWRSARLPAHGSQHRPRGAPRPSTPTRRRMPVPGRDPRPDGEGGLRPTRRSAEQLGADSTSS